MLCHSARCDWRFPCPPRPQAPRYIYFSGEKANRDLFKQIVVYKATETKRYDFEARNTREAAEIVQELKKGISPYREV